MSPSPPQRNCPGESSGWSELKWCQAGGSTYWHSLTSFSHDQNEEKFSHKLTRFYLIGFTLIKLCKLIMIASWSRLYCVDEHDVVSHVCILIEYCGHLHGSRKTLDSLENNHQQGKTTSCRHITDIPISQYLGNFYKLLICGSQDFDHSAFWIRAKQHHKK